MKKTGYIPLLVSFLLSMMIISTVSATSWVDLEPQEVVDRAEVIVLGKYDFTGKPKPGKFVFQGLDFNVEKFYKGDLSEQLTAGIDYNDVGWADEFQKEGGVFLLFLEKGKDADFLIPVGGPNGIIQLANGKVEHPNDEKRTFFEDFLKINPEKTMDAKPETQNNSQNNNQEGSQNDQSFPYLYVIGSIFVGFAVLFLLYRYKRK
ncbi:hypothetical protein SM124_11720 [Bacillus sp. 31A1R]|uniref:Uncharacterized protein n=1 Tax=Robertmurraya mangrovi TaxID=3098077 RepID=A0ABU5IZ55_9BACI|nr:hypothetical protein [Bacillus sp. 31A1R]MDZ5472416.1 hypothetical protein [Bacillus sp. 31A1R]